MSDDSNGEPLLELAGASLGYGRRVVLERVDLSIRRGAFVGVVGPNGSGKTTLLRALLSIDLPLSGSLRVSGSRRPRIGYVPQRARIDPIFPLHAYDVVAMGRYPHHGPFASPTARDREAIDAAARAVGIEDLLDRPYRDLSGGQQQRALLARAIAVEPDLLVLDEPTNGMDLASEAAICEIVEDLHRRRATTVIFVTHLLHLVADAATELVLLSPDSGGRSRCVVGARDSILTSERLTAIYGRPIDVIRAAGRTMIAARRGNG